MKKISILVILLVIVGAVIWRFNTDSGFSLPGSDDSKKDSEVSVPTDETIKVSDKLSEYRNNELGFAVKYPTAWEREDSPTGVTFIVPTENSKEKNTIGNLQSKIDVLSGKCAFPPVTTIKERDTIKVGDFSFNMISIANTVQGRNYFNRMYSLQKDSVCYMFTFTSITLSPTSKGFVGADAQKVAAQNKILVDTSDAQFKDMVNSFRLVVGPAGEDETKVSPKK